MIVEGQGALQHKNAQHSKMNGANNAPSQMAFTTTFFRKTKQLPQVFCIVSSHGCFSLFRQVLDQVEKGDFSLLPLILAQPVPGPGKSMSVSVGGRHVQFTREVDLVVAEHVSFSALLSSLR